MEKERPGGEMKAAERSNASHSELLPILGQWNAVRRKAYVLPVLVTVVMLALFSYGMNDPRIGVSVDGHAGGLDHAISKPVLLPLYDIALGAWLTLAAGYVIYRMAGKVDGLKPMFMIAVVTGLLANCSTLYVPFHRLFDFGIGDPGSLDAPLRSHFLAALFAAGLPEELFKAVPIAVCVWLTHAVTERSSPLYRFRLTEPLDGILIGAGAGLGFAFHETLFIYVPNEILHTMIYADYSFYEQHMAADHAGTVTREIFENVADPAMRDTVLAIVVQRFVGNIFSHPAYSGIVGYYIGLASLRPSGRTKTVLTGLVIACGLHALWDMWDLPDLVHFAIPVMSFMMLAAVVMKAREISPNRGDLMASQLLDHLSEARGKGGASTIPASAPKPSPQPSTSAPGDTAANGPGKPSAKEPPRSAAFVDPAPGSGSNIGSETWGPVIELGGMRTPVRKGEKIFEVHTPGIVSARRDGVVGEVVPHPEDPTVLGLMNLSEQSWDVVTGKGERRQLAPGRSLRLRPGTHISFGDCNAEVK